MATYFLTAFPYSPEPVNVHPSLASLPKTEKSWSIYPEDFYPGGGYAELPNGNVCFISFPPLRFDSWIIFTGSVLVARTGERQEGI